MVSCEAGRASHASHNPADRGDEPPTCPETRASDLPLPEHPVHDLRQPSQVLHTQDGACCPWGSPEELRMASRASEGDDTLMHAIDQNPVTADMAVPKGTPPAVKGMIPVPSWELLPGTQELDDLVQRRQVRP